MGALEILFIIIIIIIIIHTGLFPVWVIHDLDFNACVACVLLKSNLRVWQLVFVWTILPPLWLQLYFLLAVYLLDFIKLKKKSWLNEWNCTILTFFFNVFFLNYLSKADNWIFFLGINKVLSYCIVIRSFTHFLTHSLTHVALMWGRRLAGLWKPITYLLTHSLTPSHS